jgi:hypothetical protein
LGILATHGSKGQADRAHGGVRDVVISHFALAHPAGRIDVCGGQDLAPAMVGQEDDEDVMILDSPGLIAEDAVLDIDNSLHLDFNPALLADLSKSGLEKGLP